ncbi:MAG: hypothetical protein K6F30_05230 [Lachnospiraceae bacterium]|nr:hypothetical protein [Lachnospiraceae bacterium]
MNIAFNSQSSFFQSNQLYKNPWENSAQEPYSPVSQLSDRIQERNEKNKMQRERLLRELQTVSIQKTDASSNQKPQGIMELLDSQATTEEEESISSKYDYKDVSSKIRSAKTSQSAGQALIAAKRTVSQIKRKLVASGGDSDELKIALSHAKRIEIVAKKKKRHLELEELVENTRNLDERMEKQEELVKNGANAGFGNENSSNEGGGSSGGSVDILAFCEDKVAEGYEIIEKAREEMMDEMVEEAKANGEEITEEMMKEMEEVVSEFGSEELEALEKTMELLENLEVVDPHMSEEDLEKLKQKHRASEEKAIMKADMDYLKDMFELYSDSMDVQV